MAALVPEPVAPAQQCQGAVVDGDEPAAAVELDDAGADVVEQVEQRGAEGPGLEQRVPDGTGLVMVYKRLEEQAFVWPATAWLGFRGRQPLRPSRGD